MGKRDGNERGRKTVRQKQEEKEKNEERESVDKEFLVALCENQLIAHNFLFPLHTIFIKCNLSTEL